ncbi:MAG: mannitol dehydrogenase family protein [Bdellovibrionota bacterium]
MTKTLSSAVKSLLHKPESRSRRGIGELLTDAWRSLKVPRLKDKPRILRRLREGVSKPDYRRSMVGVGIVHIGPGKFFRAMIAPIADELIRKEAGGTKNWGVSAISLRSNSHDAKKQHYLYTLLERNSRDSARIIGAVREYLHPDESVDSIVNRLADPAVKLVTMAITNAGYTFDSNGDLDLENRDIRHDLKNPTKPTTAIGVIAAGLKARMEKGIDPCVIMSCDNIPPNGEITQSLVLEYIEELGDKDLLDYVSKKGMFPNTMADRIAPAITPEYLRMVSEFTGIRDSQAVITEPYRQLIIQDLSDAHPNFRSCVGSLEACEGVVLTKDVDKYALMKARLVNSAHVAVAWLATRVGLEYVHEVMHDETLGAFMAQVMKSEILPTLNPINGVKFEEYTDKVIDRFSNQALPDGIYRLNNNGFAKIRMRILNIVQDSLDAGKIPEGLILIVACWMHSRHGLDEQGRVTVAPIEDIRALEKLKACNTPDDYFNTSDLFRKKLIEDEDFRKALTKAFNLLGQMPLTEVIRKFYLDNTEIVERRRVVNG